jgi:Ran GTPase-activating protein 1
MLVERMTDNLSSVSFFSRKYGLLSKEEAAENAKRIEETAFLAANDHEAKEPNLDDSSVVQFYAREASKLMLEALKRGPTSQKQEHEKEPRPETVEVKETIFDISRGDRGFVDEKLAEELLRPLAEEGNSYTKICFSNRSFGLDSARVAERVLIEVQRNLTDVDLSDFIAGRSEAEALEVMTIFSSVLQGCELRSLNLSDNALGEKGVRAFGSLLKSQKTLEELYFMNNGISVEAARAICELLPSVERLRVLHFHNNMTGDDGAEALSGLVRNCTALEDFRCSSTRVGAEGGIALVGALGAGNRLKKLDLRDNMFGKKCGVALSRALSGHLGLTEAYLSYLGFQDKGTIALANSLKEGAPSLKVLEIAGNDVTVKAAPALAECLGLKRMLTKLVLSENELKDEGSVVICGALVEGHEHLKELDLSSNFISGVGAKAAAESVINKPDFDLLNIDGNCISEEGIDAVKDVLRRGVKGVTVLGSLEDNNAEGEGDDYEDEDNDEDGDEDDDGNESSDSDDDLEAKLKDLKMQ